MKLQRVVAYEYNGKTHSKYLITLPEEAVNALKWEAGAELKESIEGKKLVLVSLGSRSRRR